MSNAHVWRAAQERLRKEMTQAQFDTWLRGTWLDEERDGVMALCVRTTFAKELLETRYRERIEAAIASVTGHPCTIQMEVVAGEQPSTADTVGTDGRPYSQHSQARRQSHASHQNGPTLFDDFLDDASQVVPATMQRPSEAQETHPYAANLRKQPALPVVREREFTRRVGVDVPPVRKRETPAYKQAAQQDRDAGREYDVEDVEAGESEQVVGLQRPRGQRGMAGTMNRQASGDDDQQADAPDDFAVDASPASRQPDWSTTAHSRASELSGAPIAAPRLNQRYTFSTFIVGSGNQLAHAASQAVADTPGRAYNPLFLYGGVGLGKTHLLHAIGHTALVRNLVVLYVSSETFTNEIVNAIRYRTTEEFRAKYRSVDVLLVDDIQFIAGKDSTEEEFFHTFNSLYEASKQIVICSDRPPKAIVSLEERLRSRFEWGLIADIQPPDLETRVAILRAKSDVMGRHVPDEVIDYLASRVQSNIRELEGSFNRLLALTQLQGLPLTLETAKVALNNLANDGHQKRVNVDEILEVVAEYYRISRDVLCGKQRDKHIVVPRQVAMFLMRQETQSSLLEIGHALGGRDHSTVLHGCEKIAREVNDNTTLRKEVMAIRQQLLG